MYKMVIHLPTRQEDVQKLMQEIAHFRVEQTQKWLREWAITPAQLRGILSELDEGEGDR